MTPIDEGLLRVVPGFLSDHAALFEALVTGVAWDDRIRARRVASFGVPYNYSGTVWPEVAMPAPIATVTRDVAAVVGYAPNNCLANYYPDGESTMGYHADAVAELAPGTGITIVSLGATRTLSLRGEPDRTVTHALAMEAGSLVHMTAALQTHWRHAVLRAPEVTGARISLTFRRLRRDDAR